MISEVFSKLNDSMILSKS